MCYKCVSPLIGGLESRKTTEWVISWRSVLLNPAILPAIKITGHSNTDNLVLCNAFHQGIWQHSVRTSSLPLRIIRRKKKERKLETVWPPTWPTPKKKKKNSVLKMVQNIFLQEMDFYFHIFPPKAHHSINFPWKTSILDSISKRLGTEWRQINQ